ncbi:MAG: hypothetical protein ACE5Z5_11060, partial [Candidatus Bathyarchaeia archaeon]
MEVRRSKIRRTQYGGSSYPRIGDRPHRNEAGNTPTHISPGGRGNASRPWPETGRNDSVYNA